MLDQVERECGRAVGFAMRADAVLGIAAFDLAKVIGSEVETGADTAVLEAVKKRLASALEAGQRFRDAIYAVESAVGTNR
jgi:aspartyl aminopeptidase